MVVHIKLWIYCISVVIYEQLNTLFIFISRTAWNLKFVLRDLSGNELQSLPEGAFDGLAKISKL